MSITIEAQATRTLIQQDGVSRVAINDDGSMELLTPPSVPSGNMVTTFNQFGNFLSANGWQKLPSGLIIQWGQTSHTGESIAWTFPIAFPAACQSVLCNMKTDNGAAIVMSNTNSQAFGSSTISATNTTGTHNYNWLAIGY